MEVVKTLGKGVVPRAGVEPARPFGQWILSPQRLPFRHPGICQLSLAFLEVFTLTREYRQAAELGKQDS
jgi:hypothetical protein